MTLVTNVDKGKKSPQKILLIQLGDIGDVVLTFPCVRAIKESLPDAEVFLAVREKAAELVELCRWASGAVVVKNQRKGIWGWLTERISFFYHLRRQRFDLAIDMRTGTRGAILALSSGAKRRAAIFSEDGNLWRNRVFTELYQLSSSVPLYHIVDYNLCFLSLLSFSTESKSPEFTFPDHFSNELFACLEAEKVPDGRPLVAVQPFSLWQYKEWPQDKFVVLIRWLVDDLGMTVVVTGGAEEREKARGLVQKCGCSGVFNLAGKTSIGLYAALLKKCRFLISVDSAGPHIAAAAGTPTVTLYGPASPKTWAPRGQQHKVVQKNLPCVPCSQTGCNGSMRSRCLEEMEVWEVQNVLLQLL